MLLKKSWDFKSSEIVFVCGREENYASPPPAAPAPPPPPHPHPNLTRLNPASKDSLYKRPALEAWAKLRTCTITAGRQILCSINT